MSSVQVGGFTEDESRTVTAAQVEESRNLSRDNAPSYEGERGKENSRVWLFAAFIVLLCLS